MKKFTLVPSISPVDLDFKNKIGKEKWDKIRSEYVLKYKYQCQGCGLYMVKNNQHLKLHVVSGDIEEPEQTELTILCPACHVVQHVDLGDEHGFIKLVNSIYSQSELIRIGRKGVKEVKSNLSSQSIIILEKDVKEYLEELKDYSKVKNNKIKVLISSKFDWSISKEE